MFSLKDLVLSDKNFFIEVKEDFLPYNSGFVKGKDLWFSLTIRVYKAVRSGKGKFLSAYCNVWENEVSPEEIVEFVSKIFQDLEFREEYLKSCYNWFDRFFISADELAEKMVFFEEESYCSVTSKIKPLNKKIVSKEADLSNLSLKLDALSLFISDSELNIIKQHFEDRGQIVHAIYYKILGEPLDNAIELSKQAFNVKAI